jgi:CMP-2-keto-3-deoxyoctulosonic acid synthetase
LPAADDRARLPPRRRGATVSRVIVATDDRAHLDAVHAFGGEA